MKKKASLFFTAVLQVTFVSMSTVFVSRNFIPGMILAGFMISYLWTINVKKVAIGDKLDRFIYASGAATGTYLGYVIAHNITVLTQYIQL